jgi:hypothetical protein
MDKTSSKILKLSDKRKTNREIAEILNKEGIKNARGKPFTEGSIEMRRLRLKTKQKQSDISDISDAKHTDPLPSDIPVDIAEAEPNNSLESDSELSEVSDLLIPATEPDSATGESLPENWKDEIIHLVQTEFHRLIHSPDISIHRQAPDESTYDLPPTPQDKITGASGRPVNPGKRVKIAGTVDAELDRLFQEWRDSRGMSLSRALDTALWHFLGKPKLSFEASED